MFQLNELMGTPPTGHKNETCAGKPFKGQSDGGARRGTHARDMVFPVAETETTAALLSRARDRVVMAG